MYIGIDTGGTKTLLAVLNDDGIITEEIKFATPDDYQEYLKQLSQKAKLIKTQDFKAGGLAIPATIIDRQSGIGKKYGNLAWLETPILRDVEKIFNCPFVLENDAKLAALSEAMLLKDSFQRVLYVTVSTGIGYGLVVNGKIDPNIGDGGGRTMLLENNGRLMPWEDFASGRAIVEKYGKKAEDIHDNTIWQKISADLAKGFIELIAICEPEVIVVGGGVGNYFERFETYLTKYIKDDSIPLIDMPVLMKAQRPDQAVVYGCYDLAKQVYGN